MASRSLAYGKAFAWRDALPLESAPISPEKSAGINLSFWLFELMGFEASGCRQYGGPTTAAMMGDPGLLQEGPDVSALLPERGVDREQTAAAQCSLGGLDAMADLAVDHRLPKRSLSGVVGGFDALDLQESSEGLLVFQQFTAGAHRSGPGHCFSLLGAQIHPPVVTFAQKPTASACNIASR